MWTDNSLGLPLDLGASWIHGVDGNPLSELADSIGAQRSVTNYESHRVRDAQGSVVAPSDFTSDFVEVSTIEHEYAADVADLSPEASEEGDEFGGDDVLFPNGYDEVLEVLVTVPLGVLKSGSIDFQPPLDRDRQGAIDRLGMGLLDKVYLQFDEIFWETDVDVLGYIGPERGRFSEALNALRNMYETR